jgi:hypothetical protein
MFNRTLCFQKHKRLQGKHKGWTHTDGGRLLCATDTEALEPWISGKELYELLARGFNFSLDYHYIT